MRDLQYFERLSDKLLEEKAKLVEVLKQYADIKRWSSQYDIEYPSTKPIFFYKIKFEEYGYKLARDLLIELGEIDD